MLNFVKKFLAMYAPSEKLRVLMYKNLGIKFLGKPNYFGTYIFLDTGFSDITIGNNVLFSGFITILSHCNILGEHRADAGSIKPVVIKDNVRIGVNVTIVAGVTIGENAVIGAGAVVIRDVPPNCLAAGSPAKVCKNYQLEKENTKFSSSKYYACEETDETR